MTEQPGGRSRVVRGVVVLPSGGDSDRARQLIIQVEDVSRADAPSRVIGELKIKKPKLSGEPVPFEIEVPEDDIDESGSYSVRAHVDFSGSGEVESGDLLSTQSYPVLTRGHASQAKVQVRKI